MDVHIKPTGTRVLVSQPLRPPRVGTIELPQQYQDDERHRLVLAVGPKVTLVAPGDQVICELNTDYTTMEDGTNRAIIKENQIVMVATKAEG